MAGRRLFYRMDLVVRMVVMVSTDRMNKLQVVSSQHGMDGERMEEAVKSTLEEGGGELPRRGRE